MSGRVRPSSRARTRPRSRDSEIRKGADLFERFTGHEAEFAGRVKVADPPRVGVAIGVLDFVGYTTVRDGVREKYIHKFRASDKPTLVVSPDGKSLHLVGGRYVFTERGIVDLSDVKNLPPELARRLLR